MDHLAIMSRRTRFIEKIINQDKIIESRWYKTKRSPWGKINKGDAVYFKYTGGQVIAKAQVIKVDQLGDLTNKQIKKLLDKYWQRLGIPKTILPSFVQMHKDKKYGILIFLDHPKKIKPFQIDKKGFGAMSAWVCIDNIKKIAV